MNILDPITSRNELLEILKQSTGNDTINPENLHYAIYARRSSEEDTKQVRSIEDQLTECKELAKRLGVFVLSENIIQESGSAKTSGTRPLFKKLLIRIEKGELDGIITWHPDRLTRNMLEAGQIIDMLDNDVIKDLKFVSHPFTNDNAGKMLLGILFVMAKQYSEKLSVDITRGNSRSTLDGRKVGVTKHGYIKDSEGLLRPDGNNFIIIKEAFARKIKGETLEEIANFIRNSGYTTRGKDNKEVSIKVVTSTLDRIFKDTVYMGFLKYGKEVVDLTEKYDFIPILTVEEFLMINTQKSYEKIFRVIKSRRSDKMKKADLLVGQVVCSECNNVTQAGISKGKTTTYYYYRCETDGCIRKNKGTRAKVIVDYVKIFLKEKPFSSKKAYSSYKEEIIKIQLQNLSALNSQIASLRKKVSVDSETIGDIKNNLAKETDIEIKKIQKEAVRKLEDKIFENKTLLEDLIKKKDRVNKSPVTFNEFMEIMEKVTSDLDKVQSTTELNAILSKIYLNFTVNGKSVIKSTLKSPFDRLVSDNFSTGGGGGN